MEKYRKFADERTGKHPFLPMQGSQSVLHLFLAVVLLPLKFVLLTTVVGVSILVSIVFRNSQAPLARHADQLMAKFILAILGISVNSINPDEVEKVQQNPSILLSNHSSFIDSLILKSM
jgi:hypothetical protein